MECAKPARKSKYSQKKKSTIKPKNISKVTEPLDDLKDCVEELENSLEEYTIPHYEEKEESKSENIVEEILQCKTSVDSKCDSEIILGYDIIADYPSSTEEAAVLISSTSDELSTSELSLQNNEPSAPFSLLDDENITFAKAVSLEEVHQEVPYDLQNYFHDGICLSENKRCYPDIISQISSCADSTIISGGTERLKPYSEAEMSNLYYNSELRNHESFVNNFIEIELKSGNGIRHPLYELLTGYLTSRDNLCKNKLSFDSLLEDYKQFRDQIWTLDTSSYTDYGECQDGNPVAATHHFTVAHFNNYIFDNFSRVVSNLEILTMENYVTNVFNEKLYRIKIKHYVDSLCYNFNFLASNVPVQLYNEKEPRGPFGADFRYLINDLRNAISVLFSFQRRPIKDNQFIIETRKWLEKLISVLLRISTANDHLFLLHQIIRCPPGVGKWASHFIQPPMPRNGSMDQHYIDHLITTLAAILLPVQSRETFLEQMEAGLEENGVWVMIDSDGEDFEDQTAQKTAFKEADLIYFLNQIPFSDLFRRIMLINYRDGEDVYDVNTITDRDILRSIAVGTLLVNLFEKGIANYSAPTYKQFCKLLSRLIMHTASYISEHWQIFREAYTQRNVVNSDMLNRLQTEYDEFLLRVVNTLFTTHDKIGWQYLATLPFGMITTHTLWRLYQYLFHTNSENDVLMSEEFMEILAQLPDNDIYYFLTTITNMALNRKEQDALFIQSVILQLFKIGFVNGAVRDKCMKPARILISNLTNKHPRLISDLMLALKKNFILVGKYSLYLFKELPIALWKPTQVDTLTFKDWLLNYSLTSWESNLTRYILSQLNWSLDCTETDLFLSRDFHCQIAVIIVKAVYIFMEETPVAGSTAIISQGMRQVSSIVRNQTPEQALNSWAWQILSKLKLHLLDQPVRIARMTLTDVRMSASIPDINADIEDMCILSEGIKKESSVACYVALLISNVGHSIPLICEFCWDYCNILLSECKYSQVFHILQLIIPHFLNSIDALLKQEKFIKIISTLLSADMSYRKMAKNLIISDFPREVLSQFVALIQYHLDNFSRYCLPSPNQMVELWMRVLSVVWAENCPSVACIMDKILCLGFFDDSLKQLMMKILSELIQNLSASNRYTVTGGFFSLVNWIGYSGTSETTMVPNSLLPRTSNTVTHSPYFAFFALHLEEYFTQTETQLWSEVLKTLAATVGKANVDAAVKKACFTLKLSQITASWLSIYRWSQYALELPCDHPILHLFWQRFFRLYLYRVPGNTTIVCVGSKFFEGTLNYNYYKKIKNKLRDCEKCYIHKASIAEYEKPLYESIAQLYKSFLLWLEEPKLQESELFAPALSATFNVAKLIEIINGDETPWLELIDIDKIKAEQKKFLELWNKILHRDSSASSRRIICFPEDVNVVANMLERLRSYDEKLPPPELVIVPSIIPAISQDTFIDKSQLLDNLAEHFQILSKFTKSYVSGKSEQNNEAKTLLEAYKYLYSEVEVEVKLYAACDTASPIYKRRTVSTIHCAGPALITLRVREGRQNKSLLHTAERSDIDFQRLMKENVKNTSVQVTVACIVIQLSVEMLSKEITETRRSGDLAFLNVLQEVGVALFYKLISAYDSEISEYFPIRLLIRKMIEKLGQACIDEMENECPKLLTTILKTSRLSEILIRHFNPSIVAARVFVCMYQKVTAEISSKNVEIILDLITKFDVKDWLCKKKPKLVDRSKLIKVISFSLKEMGSRPLDLLLPLYKILLRDLCEILMYDFPEHYGEILHVVLRYSAEEKFSCDVWYDVLNSLLLCASGTLKSEVDVMLLRPGLSVIQIRDIARKYAAELRSLNLQELIETCNMLGGNFLKERLRYGLYGLYPKYKMYIEPIIAFYSMVGHAVVASVLNANCTALANQICEKIWPVLLNLFAPWVTPYFTGNLQEPPEAWIQQLTDDRSILLPWTSAEVDMILANKMMATFTECLKFILDALPASNIILNNVFEWYITQFAHGAVKEHVLTIVQNNLIVLNWSRFVPSLIDMELMLKITDQYLPMCHSFLGSVFIDIPWKIFIRNDQSQSAARVHIILLNLLIKLANEPNLRQVHSKSGKVSSLLHDAHKFHWQLVDAVSYEHVLNWFVMSYDSRVLLLVTDEDWNGIDMAAFELLQTAAGYVEVSQQQHPTTSRKRQLFVKACVKLILQLVNRYKTIFSGHHLQMELTIGKMLDEMEAVITATVPVENRPLESALLLSELLILVNQPNNSTLPKLVIQVLNNWLSHRGAESCVLQGLLRISSTVINDHLHLGIILESCLVAWFKNSAGLEKCCWNKVLSIIQNISFSYPPIEDTFVSNSEILSLYAVIMKQMENNADVFLYSKIIQWITNLKPSADSESKLPVLWTLAFKNYNFNWSEVMSGLLKLNSYFQQIINMKPSWGLFGVIRITKQHIPSIRCKVLCYALSTFILMKLSKENCENSMQKSTDSVPNESRSTALVSAECVKNISALECLVNDKHYAEYRVTIELAIRLVKSKDLTLSDGEKFIITLAKQLYTEGYIHAFSDDDECKNIFTNKLTKTISEKAITITNCKNES